MKNLEKVAKVSLVALSASLASCSGKGEAPVDASAYTWTVVKSPKTGKCYEIASHRVGAAQSTYGTGGMSEVPCEYLDDKRD